MDLGALATNTAKQIRSAYERTTGNFLVNTPDGFPSAYNAVPPPYVWWTGSDTWRGVLGHGAAGIPAVTRAENIIVGTLSNLPWIVISEIALDQTFPLKDQVELPSPRWLVDPTMLRPDARVGESISAATHRIARPLFWGQWIRSALLYGMGYVIFQENEAPPHPPKPGTFRVLNPHHVDAYQAEDGWVGRRIGGEVDTDRDGYFTLGSTRYRLLELNNPLFSPNEQGISPGVLESFPQTFEVIKAQREFARGSFRSGIPSGYLKSSNPQLSDQAARRMQEQWMLAHGGEDHRSVAVLNATTSFTPIALTAVDSALVDMSRLSTLDVALMFGVPPNMLGVAVSESLTYQTAETRTLDLRTYSLTPWATVIEETLSALLPQGQRVSISFQGMMRADMATRVRYYEAGQSGGWLTVNEIRAAENLPQFAIAPESEPEQTDQSEGEQDAEDQLQ